MFYKYFCMHLIFYFFKCTAVDWFSDFGEIFYRCHMEVFSWFLCIWDITCVVHYVSRLLKQQREIYSKSHQNV